ncbi:MAG: DNA-protecting protein DprA [Candidatus Marinimicrobia bacterium]|nr:DNA-protecting protein DprA [Candidatus Neomarinimicrobiota bacterium]
MAHFENGDAVFNASKRDLCQQSGIDIVLAESIMNYKDFGFGEAEVEKAGNSNVSIVSIWDDEYPILLKKIYDPPAILFTKGQSLIKEEDAVAIVGTRRFTPYGRSMAKSIAKDLNSAGITIVSGMARGIDSIAHKETVKNDARTIAVLGSGIDVIYPAENRKLFTEICEIGTVISEFRFGTKPDAGNFPQRNRIISGLSHATVIIEAGHKSGAILTALNAVDQNRDVFAVPGRVTDPQSKGTIRLIRNGAFPVERGKQVIEQIQAKLFKPHRPRQETINLHLTDDERTLLVFLNHQPQHIDEIVSESGVHLTKTLTLLLGMELKGAVIQLSGKQFVRA